MRRGHEFGEGRRLRWRKGELLTGITHDKKGRRQEERLGADL